MTEIASNITGAAKSAPNSPWREGGSERIPGQRELAKPALVAPSTEEETEVKPRHLLIDIDLRFRDLKAAVPLFTQDLSYVNNALIRPIVAFIK
jgi:distribution and morphology protein 31